MKQQLNFSSNRQSAYRKNKRKMQKQTVDVGQNDEKTDNIIEEPQAELSETTEVSDAPLMGHSDLEKNKPQRRYWTPKEEERLFIIWGRENWQLTRHGKNTVHFGHWSEEMRERYNIDIKPEEIQAKVNQTRCKYRQVKKQTEADGTAVRWKKYDIIEKILRNEYRPTDAEPVPAHALENNRDVSPSELNAARQHTPTSFASNSVTDAAKQQNPPLPSNIVANEQQINVEPNTADVNLSNVNLFNTTDNSGEGNTRDSVPTYNTELFSDDVPIKKEDGYDYNDLIDETPLKDQQTPQQYLIQQQNEIYQQHTNNASPLQAEVKPNTAINVRNIQSMQQQSQQLQDQINNQIYGISQNNQHYIANNNNNSNINNNPCSNQINSNNGIITPRAASTPATAAPARKRRAPAIYNNYSLNAGTTPTTIAKVNTSNDSLELLYMEEVRKKNRILDEQREIAQKRLQLEERKLALMEQFFPKCLGLQEQILQKLNGT